MNKLFRLKGEIQNYAWGGTSYIPNLLGVKSEDEKCAEYWLGAHNNAPSTLFTNEGEVKLNNFISANLVESLGAKVAEKFGRLSFLFKVLDVHEMLSIQVHPTKKEAEKGFKLENDLGIPLTATNRNYKDDNHKPEIMVALSEFWLLHGFLSKEKIIQVLEQIPEFSQLLPVFNEKGYLGLYKAVMEQSDEERNKILKPLIDRILPKYRSGDLSKSDPAFWAARAVDSAGDSTNIDKGVYSIYFFNLVKADIGEAIFQDAGIPHAYLEGQNMELMANSDNVLRGGLTPKHIDVPELLKHVTFEETIPNVMKGDWREDGLECVYQSPVPDFELSQIRLSENKTYKTVAQSAQVIIVIEGSAEVTETNASTIKLKKGQAAFIMSGCEYSILTTSSTVIYKATAP